ncbi:hypothetical protein DIE14_13450 [Burkholderia sp. Bp9017]|nr:hypothetical protein DIE14_13450 [Burkholderia sp. Bp9017]
MESRIARAGFDRLFGLRCKRAGAEPNGHRVPLLRVAPACARRAFERRQRTRRHATPDRGRAARRAPVVGQAGFDGTGNLPTNASAAATHCIGQTTVCRGAQLIMLRRWPKTVESCGAADPNRDNRHFGDA